MDLSRRALLAGGALSAAAGVATGVGVYDRHLPGRPQLQQLLGLNGAAGVVPDIEPGPVLRGTFTSAARGGEQTSWLLIRPPGVRGPLPLVVALHALGWDAASLLGDAIALPRFVARSVADGTPPYAVVAADGGRDYWHPRPDGTDASAMVTDELLPMIARDGYGTDTIGLLGWSMGGYGALRLAGLLGAPRVPAVVAASPAIWTDPDDARPTGFADAEEYREFTVTGRQAELEGITVRIDIGTGDALFGGVEDYVAGFPTGADLTSTTEPGGHTAAYWRRMLPAQLALLGSRLNA